MVRNGGIDYLESCQPPEQMCRSDLRSIHTDLTSEAYIKIRSPKHIYRSDLQSMYSNLTSEAYTQIWAALRKRGAVRNGEIDFL